MAQATLAIVLVGLAVLSALYWLMHLPEKRVFRVTACTGERFLYVARSVLDAELQHDDLVNSPQQLPAWKSTAVLDGGVAVDLDGAWRVCAYLAHSRSVGFLGAEG